MATIKKGMLTPSKEWWKHLRWTKRQFWKGEWRAAKLSANIDARSETGGAHTNPR